MKLVLTLQTATLLILVASVWFLVLTKAGMNVKTKNTIYLVIYIT